MPEIDRGLLIGRWGPDIAYDATSPAQVYLHEIANTIDILNATVRTSPYFKGLKSQEFSYSQQVRYKMIRESGLRPCRFDNLCNYIKATGGFESPILDRIVAFVPRCVGITKSHIRNEYQLGRITKESAYAHLLVTTIRYQEDFSTLLNGLGLVDDKIAFIIESRKLHLDAQLDLIFAQIAQIVGNSAASTQLEFLEMDSGIRQALTDRGKQYIQEMLEISDLADPMNIPTAMFFLLGYTGWPELDTTRFPGGGEEAIRTAEEYMRGRFGRPDDISTEALGLRKVKMLLLNIPPPEEEIEYQGADDYPGYCRLMLRGIIEEYKLEPGLIEFFINEVETHNPDSKNFKNASAIIREELDRLKNL